MPKQAEVVAGYWQRIGVKAEIIPGDSGMYAKIRNSMNSPTLLGQASTYRTSDIPVAPRNIQQRFQSKGQFGLMGKASPELDKLIDNAMVETDVAKRRETLAKAAKIITDAYVSLVIARAPSMGGLGPRFDIDFPKATPALPLVADIAKHRK